MGDHALKGRVLKSRSTRPTSKPRFISCGWFLTAQAGRARRIVAVLAGANDPAFSYAMVSFSAPERADILCWTTDIRHVFSRGCWSNTDAPGLVMAWSGRRPAAPRSP